ncbi:histidine kinase [Paenibacillus sp. TRM 82003]|nr:histidine kinase [Paenibacillus sp. TRM 82003]
MALLKFPVNSLRSTLFVRLVVTYLAVILPIILLGVYLYNWSYSSASQDIARNLKSQIATYLENVNREIEWLEIQQFDLLQDNEVNKIAVTWGLMDNVERKNGMDYVTQRLLSIKNSSIYIQDISVHLRSINKTVSASRAVQAFDAESYRSLQSMDEKRQSRLTVWRGGLHLIAEKLGGKRGEEPLFVVQIELDTASLKASLEQLNTYPQSGSFLVSQTTGYVLSSSDDRSTEWSSLLVKRSKPFNQDTFTTEVEGRHYHVNQAYSEKLGLTMVTYLPEETVKEPLSKFTAWAWLFMGTSLLAVIAYSYSTYKFVHKPLLLLVQSFRRMEDGSLNTQIVHEKNDEFGFLYSRFNQMLTKLQTLIDQDYKQKLMMQKAELKQLQSQINPHFLYNSFFILNSLAKSGDVERIETFTNMLGEYFRFITRNGQDEVALSSEIRHSRMYTEIQKLRFSRRIRVQFDELPVEIEKLKVPRLIVQPIIENAYEHCLEKMTEEGLLRVKFETGASEARIVVEDNGSELSDEEIAAMQRRLERPAESHEMTGLMNIHRRILLTYGEGSGLFLSRSEWNGLKVVIRIKFGEERSHVSIADR